MNKNKHFTTEIIFYSFSKKKFCLYENYEMSTSANINPSFKFVIQRVLSPRKMKSLFGNLFKKEFNVPWIEYFSCVNKSPQRFSSQEIIFHMKKMAQLKLTETVYIPETNFKQYIKYSGYPKVIDIPKIEVSFL